MEHRRMTRNAPQTAPQGKTAPPQGPSPRVLLVGAAWATAQLARQLDQSPTPVQVIGCVTTRDTDDPTGGSNPPIEVLGRLRELARALGRLRPGRVPASRRGGRGGPMR